jgi:hypothetical protein
MSFDWMQNNDPAGSSQAIDLATSGGNSANSDFLNLNNPGGNTADNYIQNNPYISPGYKGLDVQSAVSDPSIMSKLAGYAKNLYQDQNGNIDFGKAAMLLGGLYGASTYNKGLQGGEGAGYQGGIPQLYAGRNMITAPPTMIDGKPRRPGQGGINYGGDVTYFNTKAEVDAQKAAVDAANAAAAAKAAAVAPATVVPTANNTCPPGYTYNAASKMCVKNQVIDTKTGSTVTTDTKVVDDKDTKITGGGGVTDTRSDAMRYAETSGMGAQQYLGNINQWILDHPYASKAQIDAEMARLGVSDLDLQTALGTSNFSDATKYGLTHGMGLQEMNFNINDWIRANPYATNAQIQAEQKKYGVNDEDVARALTGLNSSAGKEYAIVHDMGLDQLYKNILDFKRAGHTEQEIADAMAQYGISNADVKAAEGFAKATGYAVGGMAKGRYLQGETDGMADELPAQIGADQPAALSHGEFVVPADVVSHLGNGNSDAGAKKLYQMMDKIRMARTGNKKQGKKINPDKFMPGGLATYAEGGSVKHFEVGGKTAAANANAGITGIESNLSNWAGPYVTNMLGQGQALANMPYQAYTGPLTAGASDLQNQAFTAAGSMSTPTSMTNAATNMGNIGQAASELAYTPTNYTNQFKAPEAGSATNFTNQYSAPTGYTPTTSAFDSKQLESYMNPYLDKILTPQLEEARRQSQITQQQNAGKMTAAGAFGGGRQAILDAETQRNLGTTQAGITGQGYNTAFTNAQQQFNADQNRKMQEAQFGSTQGMNAAQLQAQYGLSAQQANEMARQFGSQQAMTAAQQAAQYGQSANQATEASKQFGANYGLQGLQTGLQAATAQGNLGAQTGQLGLQQLAQQMAAGQTQRDIESQGIAADMAQFEEARNNPFKMIQFQQSLLQGLPTSAQAYNTTGSNALSGFAQGATTLSQIMDAINGKKPA